MKITRIEIKNGRIHMDFDGFPDNTCSDEENLIRALYAKMGVKTDVEYSDNKREREAEPAPERNGLKR